MPRSSCAIRAQRLETLLIAPVRRLRVGPASAWRTPCSAAPYEQDGAMSRWSLSAPATLALCALLNVSCVTVGQPFDTARLRDVYKGQPRTEVVDWFGEPAHGNKLSLVDSPNGCVKRYRYAFAD